MFYLFSVIVAEVTQPSLGVGYEIGRAYAMNKPILCLYRPQPEKSNFKTISWSILFLQCYFLYCCYSKKHWINFFFFIELSAMIAGMDDTNKYVVVNYKSSDELDKVFEKFMKSWLWINEQNTWIDL